MSTFNQADRDKYVALYAKQLGVENNPFSIAAHIIKSNKAYGSACAFIFGLSCRDADQNAYIRKAAKYLAEYVGDSYAEVTPEWLYEFVQGYVTDVDPSYRW